jgi:hypothetical protein
MIQVQLWYMQVFGFATVEQKSPFFLMQDERTFSFDRSRTGN